jgi:flavin reductase (DIM6/NTAB) family NADH-FMN oxidoreductase RutF
MIEISNAEILNMDKISRLNFVNSIPGYKSANLIGTKSKAGVSNLAVFSSVIHLGSNPPLLAFVMRPAVVPRNTYQNIKATGKFTINHIHEDFVGKAHYTSAKFDDDVSEFQKAKLTEEYLSDFYAPFVGESKIKIAMNYVEEYHVKANDTLFIVAEIQSVFLPQGTLKKNGEVNLNEVNDVCISGLYNYHKVEQLAAFDYVRPGSFPENKLK